MSSPDATSIPAPLDAAATSDALATAAVVRWWQTTAFLEVAGPEAASFLDGLCTQAVERIEPGTAVLGLFLDAKAKIIAPATLHRTDAETFLLETLPELVEPLRAHLKKYRLRAKATLEPRDLGTVALVGERLDERPPEHDEGSWLAVREQQRPTLAFVGSTAACAEIVRSIGLPLADPDAFEADRIERAVAGLHDLLPGRMPAEVGGMDAAVALDAGCYLGQEPVARLHYRGHANRTLRRLAGDEPLDIAPGEGDAPFELRPEADPDARAVGRIATWASRPDGGVVALAMLRREVAVDTPLVLGAGPTILRPIDAPAE